MNKDIKQLAEETLTRYNNVEWTGEGLPVYSAEQMIAAMVEMYTAGAREATSPPLDELRDILETIEGVEENQILGNKNEVRRLIFKAMFDLRSVVKQLEANNVATTTPLSSSGGNAQKEVITTWRGFFEVIPFKDYISEGDYYLVDYNRQSHPSAPDKENEIVKIISKADYNGYYLTDRGTKVKGYCLIKHLKPLQHSTPNPEGDSSKEVEIKDLPLHIMKKKFECYEILQVRAGNRFNCSEQCEECKVREEMLRNREIKITNHK